MTTKRSKTAPKVSKNTSKRMHNRSKGGQNGCSLSLSVVRRICQPCLCSLIRSRSEGLTAPSWSCAESRRICFSLCCHPRLDRGSSVFIFFSEDPAFFAFVAAPSHGAFFSEVVIPSEALVLNEVKELSLAQPSNAKKARRREIRASAYGNVKRIEQVRGR